MLVDRSTLLKYLPDQPITNIAVYVKPGVDAKRVRQDLETRLRDFPLMIAPNEVLRRTAVEVFDRTFAVTYALEAVAIVVAMLRALCKFYEVTISNEQMPALALSVEKDELNIAAGLQENSADESLSDAIAAGRSTTAPERFTPPPPDAPFSARVRGDTSSVMRVVFPMP